MKKLRDTEAAAQSYLEHCAELLDCAGYLIELSVEKIMNSRQLAAFAMIERVVASRERIEYTKTLLLRLRQRSDAAGSTLSPCSESS